jgi:hypothetical protein
VIPLYTDETDGARSVHRDALLPWRAIQSCGYRPLRRTAEATPPVLWEQDEFGVQEIAISNLADPTNPANQKRAFLGPRNFSPPRACITLK